MAGILGVGIFFLIVLPDSPQALRTIISVLLKTDLARLIFFIVFFGGLYAVRREIGRAIRFPLILALFGIFLRGYWITHFSRHFMLFGILPWTDAVEYLSNSERLLAGYEMIGSRAGRPIFSIVYASLMWITRYNELIAAAILVLLAAIAVYLLCEQIRRSYGVIPAAGAMLVSFYYYRHYLGSISTEGLGLILGCLGLFLFLKGIHDLKLTHLGAGFFLLTMGLNTRAGPFPAIFLALISILVFVKPIKLGINALLASTAGIVCGFLVNTLALQTFVSKSVVPFGNFVESLYGLAAGGKGWGYIWSTRPDVTALMDPVRSQTILNLSLDLIRKNPLDLLQGIATQYLWFFNYSDNSIYSFLYTNNRIIDFIMLAVLAVLLIAGIVVCARQIKKPEMLILLALLVGILISIPLLPAQDTIFMRPYAVFIPLFGILPGLGLQWILRSTSRQKQREPNSQPDDSTSGLTTICWGISGLLLVLVFFPFLIRGGMQVKTASDIICAEGEMDFQIQYIPQNALNVIRTDSNDPNWISFADFKNNYHDVTFTNNLRLFNTVRPDDTLFVGIDQNTGKSAWIIGKTEFFKPGAGIYKTCGEWYSDDYFPNQGLFHIEHVDHFQSSR